MNGFHTFDPGRADELEDPDRFRYVSAEELLGAADLGADDAVLDVGSGTGFYTDVFASVAREVYALDVESAMHDHYRRKGMPDGVVPILAEGGAVPLSTGAVDVAVSTMTHHELPAESVHELARVVRPGGRAVVADWTAEGPGEAGPPVDERFDAETVAAAFDDAGFSVRRAETRRETLFVVAVR